MFTEYLDTHDLSKLLGKPGTYEPFPRRQNRAAWENLSESVRRELIEWGDEALAGYPMLTASQFLAYCRTGDRQVFEKPYFARRKLLIGATFAECVLDDETHLDAVIDGLWAICEESTWVVSAHNDAKHLMTPPMHERPLPDVNNPYIDLFAAQTSATLAWVLYFMEDKLDAVTPRIARRVRNEIERRIIQPFRTHDAYWIEGSVLLGDGAEINFPLESIEGPQKIDLGGKHRIRTLKLHKLIKCDNPSAFPALRQIEVFGTDI